MHLTVSATLGSLKDVARANGCSVAEEHVDKAESGRVANSHKLGEMIGKGIHAQPTLPSRSHSYGNSSASSGSANTPWPSSHAHRRRNQTEQRIGTCSAGLNPADPATRVTVRAYGILPSSWLRGWAP